MQLEHRDQRYSPTAEAPADTTPVVKTAPVGVEVAVPESVWDSDESWTKGLPQWFQDARLARTRFDTSGIEEAVLEGYARAFRDGNLDLQLLARLMGNLSSRDRVNIQFERLQAFMHANTPKQMRAFYNVLVAEKERRLGNFTAAAHALSEAITFAEASRDVMVDTLVFDAIGDYNQQLGHFDAVSAAYAIAYRPLERHEANDRRKLLLALNLAMVDIARGKVSDARTRFLTTDLSAANGVPRLENFVKWVGFLSGAGNWGEGSVRALGDTDNRLRDWLRLHFLNSDRTASSEPMSNIGALVDLARQDRVTHLPTFEVIESALDQAISSGRSFELCAVKIDDLTGALDLLSDDDAKILQQSIVWRLHDALKNRCLFGRMATNLYGVVSFDTVGGINQIAHDIQMAFKRPFALFARDYRFPIHIATALPEAGEIGSSIWRRVVASLEAEREKGVGIINAKPLDRRSVQVSMAIRQSNGFSNSYLAFQPIVDASTGLAVGAEVLARWHDPVMGAISPLEFIPLFEASGQIVSFGAYQFDLATQALRRILSVSPKFKLSVNKSVREFMQADFANVLLETCQRNGVPPQAMTLELTETTLLQLSGEAARIASELRAAGFRCALDDFGTGYCNLSYLAELADVHLKIDGRFIRNAPTNARAAVVCEMIITGSKTLNVRVVAEQVETSEQARWLLDRGCSLHQGYFYSGGVAEEDLIQLIKKPPEHWRLNAAAQQD